MNCKTKKLNWIVESFSFWLLKPLLTMLLFSGLFEFLSFVFQHLKMEKSNSILSRNIKKTADEGKKKIVLDNVIFVFYNELILSEAWNKSKQNLGFLTFAYNGCFREIAAHFSISFFVPPTNVKACLALTCGLCTNS